MLQGHPWEALRLCCLLLPLHYFSLHSTEATRRCGPPMSDCSKDTYISVLVCLRCFSFVMTWMVLGTIPGLWHYVLRAAPPNGPCLLLVREMVHRFRSYGLFWWELESETDVKPHESILTLQTPGQLANWLAWTPGHMLHSSMQAIPLLLNTV